MTGRRGEVWFVEADLPSVGAEIAKVRPCVIVQPAEMDRLRTTVVVPMTGRGFPAPFRVPTTFGSSKFILCDHVRSIDRERLRRFAGNMAADELANLLRTLQAMFAP
jgi:mRNA interferase MazF